MLQIGDRVKETTTTTGTGALTLSGAAGGGYRAFSALCSVADTVYYTIDDGAGNWETGLGTYSSANTLTRTTPLTSSNANAAVNFGAGTKNVWIDLVAAQLIGLQNDRLSPLWNSVVAITGAITLTSTAFGKKHLCSGTSADYTVVLPTAVGNGGKSIAFVMAPQATLNKFVTLDGNASEKLGYQLTRKYASFETVVLESNGTDWDIVSESIEYPIISVNLAADAVNGATGGGYSLVKHDTIVTDTHGQYDTAAWRANIKYPGEYLVTPYVSIPSATGRVIGSVYKNGSEWRRAYDLPSGGVVGGTVQVNVNGSSDYIQNYIYNAGATVTISSGSGASTWMNIRRIGR